MEQLNKSIRGDDCSHGYRRIEDNNKFMGHKLWSTVFQI